MLKYVIPADGDEMDHPNVFYLSNPSQIQQTGKENSDSFCLMEIKKQFPLPGVYQFRFKKRLSNSKTVWLDITEDDAMVPEYDGSIYAKVTRLCLSPEELNTSFANSSKMQPGSVSESNGFTPTGAGKRFVDTFEQEEPRVQGQSAFENTSSNFKTTRSQKSDSTEDPFGLFGSAMSSPDKSPGRSTNANANVNVNNKQHQTRDSDLLNFDFNSTTTTTTAAKNNSNSFEDWSGF